MSDKDFNYSKRQVDAIYVRKTTFEEAIDTLQAEIDAIPPPTPTPPTPPSPVDLTVVTITTPTTAANGNIAYMVNNTDLTLPSAIGNSSYYIVKNIGGTVSIIGTVDGTNPILLRPVNASLSIVSDGTAWRII